jgi:hypothetical protein
LESFASVSGLTFVIDAFCSADVLEETGSLADLDESDTGLIVFSVRKTGEMDTVHDGRMRLNTGRRRMPEMAIVHTKCRVAEDARLSARLKPYAHKRTIVHFSVMLSRKESEAIA